MALPIRPFNTANLFSSCQQYTPRGSVPGLASLAARKKFRERVLSHPTSSQYENVDIFFFWAFLSLFCFFSWDPPPFGIWGWARRLTIDGQYWTLGTKNCLFPFLGYFLLCFFCRLRAPSASNDLLSRHISSFRSRARHVASNHTNKGIDGMQPLRDMSWVSPTQSPLFHHKPYREVGFRRSMS
jgi:hypothetical protein